jgi:RalA-binding protein 1
MSEEISSPKAFQRISSPKSSPLNRKKFLPNFKKPGGLGNITLENLIKKKKKKMFGVSLQTAVYRSQLGSDGIELPTIFRQCIDYLEENSLEHEGIYRLAGVKSQIDAVKTLYDKETEVDLSDYDPNTVASLLKLYLRELPEPLIPARLMPKFDALTNLNTADTQLAVLRLLIDELPLCNRLLLSWLLLHMNHIADKSDVNRMNISNLVIVFSPTLQLSVPLMHLLYNHRENLFPNVEIKKYQKPQKSAATTYDLPDPSALETEEEVTAELVRLSALLEKLHTKVHSTEARYDERDDYCWELQRVVTELKRKKKVFEQLSASKMGDEQEFMKALILMAATLQAENYELKANNSYLKEQIRTEAELVESYKSKLKLYESRQRTEDEFEVCGISYDYAMRLD